MSIKIDDDGLPYRETPAPEPSYADKRGKRPAQAHASWGSKDGMGKEHDPSLADKLLNEALK